MASSRSSSSSARCKPPLGPMTGSWRRHHERSALVRTTRECGPTPSPPFLDGEPAGITRAVDRRARDERPHHGSGRLQRRFADVAGAPFDADPRRGESRRRNHVCIVNASGLAYYRADADAKPYARADAKSYADADTHPDTDSDTHAHTDAATHPDTDSDTHAHA